MACYSLILCSFYVSFLLFGGFIFMYLEWETIETVEIIEPPNWARLKEIALYHGPPSNEDELTTLVGWILRECEGLPKHASKVLTSIGNQSSFVTHIEDTCPWLKKETVHIHYNYTWSFIDSLYFSMTVSTTIGYGHISPSTSVGRVVCILYSLVGIPLTGILLAWTSGVFGESLFKLFRSMFSTEKQSSPVFIVFVSIIYILAGFVVFIFLPAFVFISIEEDWSYLEGVYFAYITLTTIGFGDFVTGKRLSDPWVYIYQICVIIWILIGLGYWVMVANFIQRALKSKKIHDLAKKAAALKKLMMEVSSKHHDPQFVSHTSKSTINFLLQLSNTLVAPELMISNAGVPTTPQIPGIAALFQQAGKSNFKQFLSAGVMNINLKTDANGNNRDRNSETTTTEQDDMSEKQSDIQSDLIKAQVEPIHGEDIEAHSRKNSSDQLNQNLDHPEASSHSLSDFSSEEAEENIDRPFLNWLMLYQDTEKRNSLMKALSLDLEHLQSPPVTGNRPLSVGCPIEAVR